MPINTRSSYIEIGTSVNSDNTLANTYQLPAPHELGTSDEFMADAARNANATMILQQIGRTQYVVNATWSSMKNTVWWGLNRWFETHGMAFYMKQFKHTTGEVIISRFYRGNVGKATPSKDTEIIDGIVVPKRYLSCSVNFIDMGESTPTIVERVIL